MIAELTALLTMFRATAPLLHTAYQCAMLSSKLIKNAELKIYKGAPYGVYTTLKDKVNEDLLAFIKNQE